MLLWCYLEMRLFDGVHCQGLLFPLCFFCELIMIVRCVLAKCLVFDAGVEFVVCAGLCEVLCLRTCFAVRVFLCVVLLFAVFLL